MRLTIYLILDLIFWILLFLIWTLGGIVNARRPPGTSVKSRRNYAKRHGYFWIPCPLCRKPFGGHEWSDVNSTLYISPTRGKGVCPNCTGRSEVIRSQRTYLNHEILQDIL